jgi:hypothetical protein
MAKIQVTVEVTKEMYELGKGVAVIVDAVMAAVKDGFQPGQDLPVIAVKAFGEMAAIEGIDKIGAEMKEDPAAFATAMGLTLSDIYKVVKANQEVAG